MGWLRALVRAVVSLLRGMAVTFRHMLQRPVTQLYPHVEPELPAAYRSAIQLVRFDATGTHDCIACMQCVRICPSRCIVVEGYKPEGIKRKRASRFEMDFALCSLCGLCIDVCPTDTLEYSRLYDLAGYRRDAWTFDLLAPFRDGEQAYLEAAREAARRKAAEREAARRARAVATSSEERQ